MPTRRRFRWLVCTLDAVIVVLGLALLAVGAVYGYAHSRQPGLDGSHTLAGLHAPVVVRRDAHGVAHIQASDLHDLYLAQGYAMAQDRFWQMDLLRRSSEGRLAEIFGPAGLEQDRRSRTLRLGATAAAEAGRLPAEVAPALDAFTAGVNLWVVRRTARLPLEFWLLRYRPQLWRNQDTLAVIAAMYPMLASNYPDKLERETFAAVLGPAAADPFPDRSPWDLPPGAPLAPPAPVPAPRAAGAPGFAADPGQWRAAPAVGGSNNWIVAGSRTFSGLPLLANDPHLVYQVPVLWWAADLACPGLHAAGAALPGVPGIVLGHNDEIAWGVTAARADVQDLYRETGPPARATEFIAVRGAAPVALDLETGARGPIVAHDAGGPLSLAWTLYAPGALGHALAAVLRLDGARDWEGFESALADFPGPALNWGYADRAGHIGYQLAGWVPRRAPGDDGSVPLPATPAHVWRGWLPFAALPRAYDPPAAVIVAANGRAAPDDPPISTDWDAPNRTRRIATLLAGLKPWDAGAMSRLQQDVVSEQDRDFARALLEADAAQPGVALPAINRLRPFRGEMDAASIAPTLVVLTRAEFLRRVLAARAGDALARAYRWDQSPVWEQSLLDQRPAAWLPPAYRDGGWDRLLLDSFNEVCRSHVLTDRGMRWGLWETLDVRHPLWSHVPLLRGPADLGPVEIDGSPLTVKQARSTALGDLSNLGPSLRFVADLADWDRSTLTLFSGESGELFSPWYRDQFAPWLRGEALPLWFSPAAVAAHTRHTLRLHP